MIKKNQLHTIFGCLSFAIPFLVYLFTMAPTTSFWDCGEFIACSVTLGVPHPPGTPLYLLIGNIFSHIPIFNDIGARVNLISPIASALSVMLLYLIIVKLLIKFTDKEKNQKLPIIQLSAFIAALTFSFTDSHWFNAVEAEVYSLSTFLTAIVVWLVLAWETNYNKKSSLKYIVIIFYLLGLAIGIHLLNLLTIPFVIMIIYYNVYKSRTMAFELREIIIDLIKILFISVGIFLFIYLGIIKGFAEIASSLGIYTPFIICLLVISFTIYFISHKKNELSLIFTCVLMILIGYSTYSTIYIRATQHPNINENNPDNVDEFLKYMNREQYGSWSIMDRTSTLKRQENIYSIRYTHNKENPSLKETLDFVWNYQIKEMYLRYFAWQFIGKEDWEKRSWEVKSLAEKETDNGQNFIDSNQNGKYDGEKLIKKIEGIDWLRYTLPLPFLFGLLGVYFHFKRDWIGALSVLSLFLATGLMIILYLNQYDPQPRERDYSYVGSFFAFSIWIGIGIYYLFKTCLEFKKIKLNANKISYGICALLIFIMPLNMLAKDYSSHNRKGNYVAWDYGYNLLNSCEPNSIIFTNGDNDTFPLWYLQEVEGIRTDVRVVNLSLLNTPWYIEQLKNMPPKLPIKLEDQEIELMEPIVGTAYALSKWTQIWDGLKNSLNEYTMEKLGAPYTVKEYGIPYDWGPADFQVNGQIKFQISPTLGSYLRVQDILILQLINDMPDDRPIYFAVTVSPNNRIGLDPYLEMEGLVYKLTKEKTKNDEMSPRINVEMMKRNIVQAKSSNDIIYTAKDYDNYTNLNQGVYRYTNLNDSTVYFNNNIERLVQNYRSGFLQLALELLYNSDSNLNTDALDILKKMDSYFPPNVISITDPMLEIQIARIFLEAGSADLYKKYILNVTNRSDATVEVQWQIGDVLLRDQHFELALSHFLASIQKYPNIFELVQGATIAYAQLERSTEAVEFLENWMLTNPNNQQAAEWLGILKSQL